MKMPAVILLAVGIALLAAMAGWYVSSRPQTPAVEVATVLGEPRPLPDFALTDARGLAFGREQLRDHWNLLFFGFTSCPHICPNTLAVMKAAANELASRNLAPRMVFISVDPERDTPERIRAYLAGFDPAFVGATGPMNEINHLASALYVPFAKSGAAEGGVDHSGALILVNPRAEAVAYFTPPHRQRTLVADLAQLILAGPSQAAANE
jgi:protein SCO1